MDVDGALDPRSCLYPNQTSMPQGHALVTNFSSLDIEQSGLEYKKYQRDTILFNIFRAKIF